MQRPTIQKVVCYVTSADALLLIKHVDYPLEVTGVQVPAGTVHNGETPEEAAVRELFEETGIYGPMPVYLGEQDYDMAPTKNEIQHRHYFHFKFIGKVRERWFSQEEHDGEKDATRFECFWIPLEHGQVLSAGRGALLWQLENHK